jgi:DNA-binding transcriptional MerR regulator
MSTRNIRAHQARGLLAAPVRRGRTAYYDEGHVRRLETIHDLQQQGYNLIAIAAILGTRDRPGEDLGPLLDWLSTQRPALTHALGRHRVVARGDDGRIRTVRPRALRAALALTQAGVTVGPAMQLLTEALDRVALLTDELIFAVSAQLLALRPGQQGEASWAELEQESAALAEYLANLLIEAFRVAVENRGHDMLPELLAQRVDGKLTRQAMATVDYG